MKYAGYFFLLLTYLPVILNAQYSISGSVVDNAGEPVAFANVYIEDSDMGAITDLNGAFVIENVKKGTYQLVVSFVGYQRNVLEVEVSGDVSSLMFEMKNDETLDPVVISGTMKPMSKTESPVPVEVYTPAFFKKNPSPSIFESMQNVNGVRPQLNCNVCNTGDIHINGMEGPYTMVLIDGMPIVSGLSTVYGLMGIPSSMVERVEIVKGPASSLYGSEAIGGLINIITKSPDGHPLVFAEFTTTSWQEHNLDFGLKTKLGKSTEVLTGLNYFNYSQPYDFNNDNFTDISLSNRLSVFQKWSFERKSAKPLSMAWRYYTEDRWGGEMDWKPEHRGGRQVYGESIYTDRLEIVGHYGLPVREKIDLSVSINGHEQDSYYGDMPFLADQYIGFGQLTWDKSFAKHELLTGLAYRYTYYDDNTTATEQAANGVVINEPDHTHLPGIFVQDNYQFTKKQNLLLGLRLDHHNDHGAIFTPRLAYKVKFNSRNVFRLNAGTGFRVVNVFTEDHAALTGARDVIIVDDLDPEKSYNINANYVKKFYLSQKHYLGVDLSAWYGYFTNKIMADYDTDPNYIIYDNLNGFAETKGMTLNFDAMLYRNFKIIAGITYIDIRSHEEVNGEMISITPILTENWASTWTLSYHFPKYRTTIDYTGNLYGPMRLPLLSETDPRDEFSPWWSLQNIQVSYKSKSGLWDIFGGVKNLLNYTPPANSIARAHDPFDELVEYDDDGNVLATEENPYALTFDPSYVFAPNQGIRLFLGIRMRLK